jgi:hypothetical protein
MDLLDNIKKTSNGLLNFWNHISKNPEGNVILKLEYLVITFLKNYWE